MTINIPPFFLERTRLEETIDTLLKNLTPSQLLKLSLNYNFVEFVFYELSFIPTTSITVYYKKTNSDIIVCQNVSTFEGFLSKQDVDRVLIQIELSKDTDKSIVFNYDFQTSSEYKSLLQDYLEKNLLYIKTFRISKDNREIEVSYLKSKTVLIERESKIFVLDDKENILAELFYGKFFKVKKSSEYLNRLTCHPSLHFNLETMKDALNKRINVINEKLNKLEIKFIDTKLSSADYSHRRKILIAERINLYILKDKINILRKNGE